VIVFRNTDVDGPFFWDSDRQPAGRWHRDGEGPVQYTSSTPDAAWGEFLRHNGIVDQNDLAGVERCLWAVEIADSEPMGIPALPLDTLTGGPATYPECQAEAARLRKTASRLVAISAAVMPATPSGWMSGADLSPGPARDEMTVVLFGARPTLVGWVSALGRPESTLFARVRYL
jgi:hypothetical protein